MTALVWDGIREISAERNGKAVVKNEANISLYQSVYESVFITTLWPCLVVGHCIVFISVQLMYEYLVTIHVPSALGTLVWLVNASKLST